MEEIWKDIKDYETLYQISNLGRVRSLNYNRTKQTKIIKTFVQKNGYISVCLSKYNIRKTYNVHRLVAKAFIDNPDNLPCVDHIDTNRLNNKVTNLRWCTHKENQNNPLSIIHFSKAKKGFKHTKETIDRIKKTRKRKIVLQFTKQGDFVRKWDSIRSICNNLGYSIGSVGECCNGKRKSAYGYIWKFA